jgi:hypothetical protein
MKINSNQLLYLSIVLAFMCIICIFTQLYFLGIISFLLGFVLAGTSEALK